MEAPEYLSGIFQPFPVIIPVEDFGFFGQVGFGKSFGEFGFGQRIPFELVR